MYHHLSRILSEPGWFNHMFDFLEPSKDSSPVLPALETLAFTGVCKLKPGRLAEMLKFRFEKAGLVCGMVEYRGGKNDGFHSRDLQGIRGLQTQGHDVKLYENQGRSALKDGLHEPSWISDGKWGDWTSE